MSTAVASRSSPLHMQGKSCFNVEAADLELFEELDKLKSSFDHYKKEGLS